VSIRCPSCESQERTPRKIALATFGRETTRSTAPRAIASRGMPNTTQLASSCAKLQHAIERAMIVSPGEALAIDTVLPRRIAPISVGDESDPIRRQYMAALDASEWVIEGNRGAASQLGLHPNTLRHRLKRMGIIRPVR
jgi:transcriptional regulator with GAF, ATPase, and Fis domain